VNTLPSKSRACPVTINQNKILKELASKPVLFYVTIQFFAFVTLSVVEDTSARSALKANDVRNLSGKPPVAQIRYKYLDIGVLDFVPLYSTSLTPADRGQAMTTP
jgi:hypothetical protein